MGERKISLTEAQNRLPELLGEVERGETLAITRNGKEVARLTPPTSNGTAPEAEETPEEALAKRTAAFERFTEKIDKLRPAKVTVEEILEWIREGRR